MQVSYRVSLPVVYSQSLFGRGKSRYGLPLQSVLKSLESLLPVSITADFPNGYLRLVSGTNKLAKGDYGPFSTVCFEALSPECNRSLVRIIALFQGYNR